MSQSIQNLISKLNDPDQQVRIDTILELGKFLDGSNVSILIPFLSDPGYKVRAAAATSISEIYVNYPIPDLVDNLVSTLLDGGFKSMGCSGYR